MTGTSWHNGVNHPCGGGGISLQPAVSIQVSHAGFSMADECRSSVKQGVDVLGRACLKKNMYKIYLWLFFYCLHTIYRCHYWLLFISILLYGMIKNRCQDTISQLTLPIIVLILHTNMDVCISSNLENHHTSSIMARRLCCFKYYVAQIHWDCLNDLYPNLLQGALDESVCTRSYRKLLPKTTD